jgi:DNA-binding MarR family transcriptional regulator
MLYIHFGRSGWAAVVAFPAAAIDLFDGRLGPSRRTNGPMTDTAIVPSPARAGDSTADAPAPATDPGLAAWRTFLQAHATVMRRLEADLEADGQLSLADLDVLLQLAGADGHRLRMSELADNVLLSRSGMTRRIDRLEASGLVRRHECAADRRGAFAGITEAGLDRLQRARPTHLRGIQEHFLDRLSADDLDVLRDALTKIIPPDDRQSDDRQPDKAC